MRRCANVTRRSFLGIAATGIVGLLSGCGTTNGAGASATTDFAPDGILRIGMEADYPPYNWETDEEIQGRTIPIEGAEGLYADGYDVKIAQEVAAGLGLEPVAVKLEWGDLIDSLVAGDIDLIIAGMTALPEREELIDFTDPYYVGTYGLMVRKGSEFEKATSIADFRGAKVLGQKDTLLDEVIDEIEGVDHLAPVATVSDQVEGLLAGDCDAITFDVGNIDMLCQQHKDLVGVVFNEGMGFSEEVPVNIGIAKGHDDMVRKINDILAGISEGERQLFWSTMVQAEPM